MTNPTDVQNMIGRTAVDTEGAKIGKIGQVYLGDESGQPVWVTDHTDMFGTSEPFAPLHGSRVQGDQLVLAVSKQLVKDAPNVDGDGHTSDEENDALHQHYAGYLGAGGPTDYDRAAEHSDQRGAGQDTSGPNTDEAMTRSEEKLHVGTEHVETGRARLRKYIVTEDVTTTVPVSHEEVRIEREPITDTNRDAALAGGDLTEEEHEVILHAERPVVDKETVPVERVKLATETVTDEQQMTEQVRKEQIEQVADGGTRNATR
jgi:uncharacterized protein (TIGR02271 family)